MRGQLQKEKASADPVESESADTDSLFGRLSELGFHRNRIEIKLRKFIKRVLIGVKGATRWIDIVLQSIPMERRERLAGVDRDEILCENLFLLDLLNVVTKNWTYFAHLEQQPGQTRVTKAQFEVILDFINKHREDAHAKDLGPAALTAVALAAQTIEVAIDPYLED